MTKTFRINIDDRCICDHRECECLATVDMIAIARFACPKCDKQHMVGYRLNLLLCEAHAREVESPRVSLDSSVIEVMREAIELSGYGRPELDGFLWEYNPIPEDIVIRPN